MHATFAAGILYWPVNSMDPLDKLDLILYSSIKRKKKEIERGKEKGIHPSDIYLYGLQKHVDGLEVALGFARQIKRNGLNMSDEMVLKNYGTEK